jgi:hypothetical protein
MHGGSTGAQRLATGNALRRRKTPFAYFWAFKSKAGCGAQRPRSDASLEKNVKIKDDLDGRDQMQNQPHATARRRNVKKLTRNKVIGA